MLLFYSHCFYFIWFFLFYPEENFTNSLSFLRWHIQYVLVLKLFSPLCQGTPSLWSIFFVWAWNSSLFTSVCAFCEALFEFQLQTLSFSVSCAFLGLFSLNSCNFKCWSSHLQINGKYSVRCREKAVFFSSQRQESKRAACESEKMKKKIWKA